MTARLDPPPWFDAERRQIWQDTIARLTDAGGLFRADPRVLETYVCAYANHAQAAQLVARSSVLITRDKGGPVENPAISVQRRAAADLARASRALGLHRTPVLDALGESPARGDGRRWCEEHQRHECKHPRKNGEPCHSNAPIPGLGACRMRSGMTTEQARAKGQANLARMYASPVDIDPGGALLDEVQWAAGHVRELRGKVAELAEAEGPDGEPGSALWWGTVEETWRDGELAERKLRAGPHVILREYGAERDRLVKTAAAAHTAGAQDQAVNVAKALGAGVRAWLDRVFADLQLQEWQWALVPDVVPRRLAELEPPSGIEGDAG